MPEDHVVIVTGGAGGLGRTMVLGLLADGRRVAALDVARAEPAMNALVAEARAAGTADRLFPVFADVRSGSECDRAVANVVDRFESVGALVNCAGLGMGVVSVQANAGVHFYDVRPEQWDLAIETNVNGPFHMARSVAPHLIAHRWGRIINVTTSYTTMIKDGFSPYGPSKAALEAATVIWSNDLKGTGVTVNVLIPGGAADTAMVPAEVVPDRGKLVKPSVMVAPLVWLTSRSSDGVTGRRFIGKDWKPGDTGTLAGWRS